MQKAFCDKARLADNRGFRSGNPEIAQQRRGNQFVYEDAVMLRIVAKLYDVPIAVVGLQQVRLGAASHFS